MPSEFDIINRYFKSQQSLNKSVSLGIGDDAALVTIPPGMQQVIAIDTMVEGIHFTKNTSPADLAYKILAVNLSDLAAMGATPAWFTLALTMPEVDEEWIGSFSDGLFQLASKHNINLVGGDTTRGPLTITIQVAGHVAQDKALLRSSAKPGDHIYVSGTIGDGCAGLAIQQQGQARDSDEEYLLQRLLKPSPRISLGQSLVGVANACIDISDGLLADLSHILEQSGVGASIELTRLPVSSACKNKQELLGLTTLELAQGGDDFELCFTVPEKNIAMLECIANEVGVKLTAVGTVEIETGLCCYDNGNLIELSKTGYQHF